MVHSSHVNEKHFIFFEILEENINLYSIAIGGEHISVQFCDNIKGIPCPMPQMRTTIY